MYDKNKILFYCGLCVVFFFLGFVCASGIFVRKNSDSADKLSVAIKSSEIINRELRIANKQLTERNIIITERVAELRNQILEDNRRYQQKISGIKFALGAIGKELRDSKDIIQGVIDGLEQIKILIKNLSVLE